MLAPNEDGFYLGLISGTSRDGADAALVHIEHGQADLLHACCLPYPPALKRDVDLMIEARQRPSPGRAAALDELLGQFFAAAARQLIEQAGIETRDVIAIGSHGQTVWHEPDGSPPVSIQLGSGSVIARTTGIPTVTDFRRADLAAGGQGAPLAPIIHGPLLGAADERRAIVNIGGIANLTLLEGHCIEGGHDTGPGNCLMDAWIQRHLGQALDRDGDWARSGTVAEPLLADWLSDPYFAAAAPKSTGLEYFNLEWLDARLPETAPPAADVQATLTELTARSLARDISDFSPDRVLLCGGGSHNVWLVERLRALLEPIPIETTTRHGLDADWLEAILFAWLARERVLERPVDTSRFTGARRPVLLGRIHGAGRHERH
ncbi:MAG: anhydro-N-acetylmuramic acid kinase [Xanthomonadales bacterium]|nr:anhydro-N-acetylmuramic acid kinase [Xanthomonadales bacterium]